MDATQLEQQTHAALDLLQLILYVDVRSDTTRGVGTAIPAPIFREEEECQL